MVGAKGTTMVMFVRFLRSQRERAEEALPLQFHKYLRTRVLEAVWYPEEDLLALIRATVAISPGEPRDLLHAFGRTVASDHLQGGIYSRGSAFQDTSLLPQRVSALWASQHNSGEMQLKLGGWEGSLTLEGYGRPSEEICTILTGYLEGVLMSSGLRSPRVSKTGCVRGGDPRCEWGFTWTEAPGD